MNNWTLQMMQEKNKLIKDLEVKVERLELELRAEEENSKHLARDRKILGEQLINLTKLD